LAELKVRLDELLERQRLSRFDNVFFLTYPMIILVMSWLSNALWQTEVFSSHRILSTSLSYLLPQLAFVFLFFVVAEFVRYVRAYYRDDLAARTLSSSHLAGGAIVVLGTAFAVLFPGGALGYLIENRIVPQILSMVPSVIWAGSVSYLSGRYVVSWSRRVFSGWFRQNLPLLVSVSQSRDAIMRWSEWQSKRSRIVWILWFGLCLPSYAAPVVLTIRVQGYLWGETVVHYWMFVALLVGSVIVLGSRSKGRSHHSQQK